MEVPEEAEAASAALAAEDLEAAASAEAARVPEALVAVIVPEALVAVPVPEDLEVRIITIRPIITIRISAGVGDSEDAVTTAKAVADASARLWHRSSSVFSLFFSLFI